MAVEDKAFAFLKKNEWLEEAYLRYDQSRNLTNAIKFRMEEEEALMKTTTFIDEERNY